MKSKPEKKSYTEWLSADELHEESKKWWSELNFAKDEQTFLEHMIKDYTIDLTDPSIFNKVKPLVESLKKNGDNLIDLFKRVQLHSNQLQIIVDDVDQLKMESAYFETHRELADEMNHFFEDYRALKSKLFEIIAAVMKKKKQKRLLS